MKPVKLILLLALLLPAALFAQTDTFPDGKPVPAWFAEDGHVDVSTLGPQYIVTRYGVKRDSTRVQTEAIQRVIDLAAESGGGVIVIPRGTFLSGNLFFKPGTHLLIRKGGVLKGSDRIADFQVMETRIEGQTCQYFPALVNADGVVLKGGKGTWADQDPTDGPCRDIIIEDCRFCKTHGCLTLGSESVDDRNVILRRCHAE